MSGSAAEVLGDNLGSPVFTEEKNELRLSRLDLSSAETDMEYTIHEIHTVDDELRNFLFTLGCYEGERVTVISVLAENYVISIKGSRYSIDEDLARAIII